MENSISFFGEFRTFFGVQDSPLPILESDETEAVYAVFFKETKIGYKNKGKLWFQTRAMNKVF